MKKKTALIVGASGIVGLNLANRLAQQEDWTRLWPVAQAGGERKDFPVAADLLSRESLESALKEVAPTHVFLSSWMRQPTEAENIRVNSGIVRNTSGRGLALEVGGARGAGDRTEALSGAIRGVRQGHAACDSVPRRAGPTRRRELLLRAGGRGLRGRGARGLWVERAPPAHDHRLCGGQRDEHGSHASDLCDDLPRDGTTRFTFRARRCSGAA